MASLGVEVSRSLTQTNDRDLDLYVCNTESPNRFYLNLGDGTFSECAAERGLDFVGASVMVGIADYDVDGDLDIYLLTHRSLHHSVHGPQLASLEIPEDTRKTREELEFRGGFRQINGRKVPTQPESWYRSLDHWEIAGQADALLRNDGTGHFADVTHESGIGSDPGLGLSCTWLDFDHDGYLDLHVANDLQSRDRLYHNNGDGTFREVLSEAFPYSTWFSMGSDFGDINNDGRFDFLVVDMASTTHYRAKVQMGDMDRFRYFMQSESPPQLMRNCLFLNAGTSRYLEIASMAGLDATDWTWAARLNDLDNDGWLDAFFTNGIARADEMNPDLRAERERTRNALGDEAVLRLIREQAQDSTPNLAFRNTGQLRFENTSHEWGVAEDAISYAAAQVDLDSDGDLDLVVSNHNQPVSIFRNNEARHGRVLVRLNGTLSNRFGVGAKVTLKTSAGSQTRQLFPTRGYMTCDEPTVHFGTGQHSIESLTVEWPSGHRQLFDDVPVNHTLVVTEPDGQAPPELQPLERATRFAECSSRSGLVFRHEEYDYDDYELQPLLPGKLSQLGPGVAWGDANGDGHEDIYVGGAAGQPGQLYVNDGSARFQAIDGPWLGDASREDMAALWVDVDADDDLDLLVASGSSEYDPGDPRLADRLYWNLGSGEFKRAADDVLAHPAGFTIAMVAADFDGDGDLDLFVGERCIPGEYPVSPRCYLLRNEGDRFEDVTSECAPELANAGLVTSAVWSDVDGDRDSDLWVATEWGPVHLFRNNAGKLTEVTRRAGLAGRLGWWNSLACGDIDGDGDMDCVALNAGWNTKYRQPTASKPTLLYHGDMSDDGSECHLIEVKSDARAGLLPVRGLSCSSGAMPFLRTKFSTYHDFAASVLTDIYDARLLSEATRFEANELASGLLINDGSGKFKWRPLPFLAQVSPGYGAAIVDLNADGYSDIYFVQNLLTREPETGAWSGGLSCLLRGNGTGDFQFAWTVETGLEVPGDAKGMALADANHDGTPDILVARNDDTLRFFLNHPSSDQKPMAVRLKAGPGNPTGVGARITLTGNGHVRQVVELYAGSGYLSQSSPTAFFGTSRPDLPAKLHVDWPNGTESVHEVEWSAEITLSQ